jgi:arginyl-tRNA synthetase
VEVYKEAVAQCLAEPLGQPQEAIVALLRTPPEPTWGDYALPCFTLAKAWGQAPPQVAAKLAETIAVRAPIARIKAQGPYLNFTLDDGFLGREVLQRILGEGKHYGYGEEGRGKTVVIDYSSPNIAKELAFHHIRSTMIGHALTQILRARGYRVEGDNHLGDWGTPFGLLIAAYKHFGWDDQAAVEDIVQLNALYVRASQTARSDPTFAEEVARQVGVGAVVFNDLKTRRARDVKFDLETILNPYGETGPYMQYTQARCASVLAAAPMPPGGVEVDYLLLSAPEERALVRKLAAYPEVVEAAAQEWEPSLIAQHLLSIAADFNTYWTRGNKDRTVRILQPEDSALTAARVTLTAAVRCVLQNGLQLLGVPTPDAM